MMYSISRPRFWLCSGAVAAALWITFRVVTADAAPPSRLPLAAVSHSREIPDPALDAMIRRFAAEAARSDPRR
jgi:hypothetical protein